MEYLGAAKESKVEYEISRSRFIARIAPADGVEAGLEYVAAVKKIHPDATHHPYAVTGSPESGAFRFSDDGEPHGTSGMPIMNVLKKKELYNTVIVVTRYFGGIKLGAGGLVQAYSHAATLAADAASVARFRLSEIYRVELEYSEFRLLDSLLKATEARIYDINYAERTTATIAVPAPNRERFESGFKALTEGRPDKIEHLKSKYFTYTR